MLFKKILKIYILNILTESEYPDFKLRRPNLDLVFTERNYIIQIKTSG